MALTPFDPALHHIGLAAADDPQAFGYLIVPPYSSEPQRQNAPPEYGSNDDQIGPRVRSRWTQDDFGGGAYQQVFGADPKMFRDCEGIIPAFLERCARTVPPLEYFSGASSVARPSLKDAIAVFATNNNVAACWNDKTDFYDIESGDRATQSHSSGGLLWQATHDPADNFIYGIFGFGGGADYILKRYKRGTSPETIKTLTAVPASMTPNGIAAFAKDFVACFNSTLFLLDVNDERTDATVTRIGRLPGQWRDACAYNGLTYILCTDAQQRTSLVAWDGQQILPITDFPFNFIGSCMKVYGGRLYVGGSGAEIGVTTDPIQHRYAEFYEVLGASLRPIFSFADEARRSNVPKVINSMNVHEGFLWLGTDTNRLIVYDITRDSIFPGPFIVTDPLLIEPGVGEPIGSGNSKLVGVCDVLSTREKLLCAVYDESGGTAADGFYRIPSSDSEVGQSYLSYVTLSEFAPEPDRLKRWSDLKILTRFGPHTVSVSQDGGGIWTALTGTVDDQGENFYGTWDLSGLDPSQSILVSIAMERDDAAWTELTSSVLSFLFLDDGKFGWGFTINGSSQVEAAAGGPLATTVTQDYELMRSTLRGYWTNRTPLQYVDLDGTTYQVTLTDFVENQPIIAPRATEAEAAPYAREAFYRIALTEV